jgi:hypothetical protein
MMTNFEWTSFTRKIAIKASLSSMYDAWTKASEIEKWFLSKSTFIDSNGKEIGRDTSVEKGFAYDWNWYLYDVAEHGKIIEANGKDYLQFKFAGYCLVDINLTAKGQYVI